MHAQVSFFMADWHYYAHDVALDLACSGLFHSGCMPDFQSGFPRRWSTASVAMLNLYVCELILI
jgi:hypothetical protein